MSTKARWAAILVAGLLFLSVLIWMTVDSPDADAHGSPSCVSNSEYNHANPGDSPHVIKKLFGTRGVLVTPTRANETYSMITYYAGVDLKRIPKKFREVRQYDVCLSPRVDSGYVLVLFDKRHHNLVVAEMLTYGTAGRSFRSLG